MKKEEATPNAIHPIQAVARRTGLSADVIRAWERRYNVVVPSRSPTRRRLYTDADIERLALLRRATLSGRRIGDVAGLPTEELAPLIEADEAAAVRVAGPVGGDSTDPVSLRRDALAALEDLDVARLEATLQDASRELSTRALVGDLLMPLMDEIGQRWRAGTLEIHHEHLATSMVRGLLDALRAAHTPSFAGPELVVATPAGQVHELGALMSAVIAAAEHWRVTYLGPDLPADQIAHVVRRRKARAVAISLVFPEDDAGVRQELADLRAHLPPSVAILAGGRAVRSYADTLRDQRIEQLDDVRDLGEALRRLKTAEPA